MNLSEGTPSSYFVFSFGRQKESYSTYYFNSNQKDMNAFMLDIKHSIKSVAQSADSDHMLIKSDFELAEMVRHNLSRLGYEIIHPFEIYIEHWTEGNESNEIQKVETRSNLDFGRGMHSKNYPLLVVNVFHALYLDSVERYFFSLPLNSEKAVSEISESISTNINNWMKGDVFLVDEALKKLSPVDFHRIGYHSVFMPCAHRLSGHLVEDIGQDLYQRLLNRLELSQLQNKSSTSSITPLTDDEMPF
jgi:hypothetical protein